MEPKNWLDRLALGTVQFGLDYGIANIGGRISRYECKKILALARSAGVRILDTAQAYGASEQVLGRLANNSFKIITKIAPSIRTEEELKKSLWQSLRNLKRNKVYGCLFHDFNCWRKNPELIDELFKAKSAGLVEKIGFSLYRPNELQYLLTHKIPVDLVQVPYSVFDQRFAKIFARAKCQEIEIHTRSVFLQGLVFIKPADLKPYFIPFKKRLEKLNQLQKQSGLTLSAICLNFALLNPNIDRVVVGVDNATDLYENISDLTLVNLNKTKAILPALKKLHCQDEAMILPMNWKKS
ncbi:MAG: aldo/keto reductase [bacterium]